MTLYLLYVCSGSVDYYLTQKYVKATNTLSMAAYKQVDFAFLYLTSEGAISDSQGIL